MRPTVLVATFALLGLGACGAARAHEATEARPFLLVRYDGGDIGMRLVELHVRLDGEPIFDRLVEVPATGDYDAIASPVCVARVPLSPGPHRLDASATYAAGFGVFEHLRSIRTRLEGRADLELPANAAGLIASGTGIDEYEATHHPEGAREIRWLVEPTSSAAGDCSR